MPSARGTEGLEFDQQTDASGPASPYAGVWFPL